MLANALIYDQVGCRDSYFTMLVDFLTNCKIMAYDSSATMIIDFLIDRYIIIRGVNIYNSVTEVIKGLHTKFI